MDIRRLLPLLLVAALGGSPPQETSGRVLDADGLPLPGARVSRRPAGDACVFSPGAVLPSKMTDASGRFDFGAGAPGEEILVEHPGHAPTWATARAGLDLRLPRPAWLEGKLSAPGRVAAFRGLRVLASVQSDGEFRLGPLPPGTPIELVVESPEARPWGRRIVLDEGESRRLELRLDGGLALEGRVAPPSAGVVVRASQGETRESSATTRADGAFTLKGLRAGPVRVVALAPGRAPAIVDGAAGGSIVVELGP